MYVSVGLSGKDEQTDLMRVAASRLNVSASINSSLLLGECAWLVITKIILFLLALTPHHTEDRNTFVLKTRGHTPAFTHRARVQESF